MNVLFLNMLEKLLFFTLYSPVLAATLMNKVARYHSIIPDQPELISIEHIEKPFALPGTVVIKNIISAINPVDYKVRSFSVDLSENLMLQ